MKKTLFITLTMAIALLIIPATGFTLSCADKVVCYYTTSSYPDANYHRVGEINIPTCWKIFQHCRPWHCDGLYKDTNNAYWENQCVLRFPILQGKNVWVEYPN